MIHMRKTSYHVSVGRKCTIWDVMKWMKEERWIIKWKSKLWRSHENDMKRCGTCKFHSTCVNQFTTQSYYFKPVNVIFLVVMGAERTHRSWRNFNRKRERAIERKSRPRYTVCVCCDVNREARALEFLELWNPHDVYVINIRLFDKCYLYKMYMDVSRVMRIYISQN